MPTSEPDCPFCEIVRREDSDAREVYRDEHVVAFCPLEPATLGHTLLVPRIHVPTIWELSEDVAAQLARVVVKLSAAIREAVEPQGLNVIQSSGAAASQTVFHTHVHLVPRWEGDAVGQIWPRDTAYSDDQMDETLNRLRVACRKMGPVAEPANDGSQPSDEDRRKHLDYIQAAIARMSSASSSAKGWLLPVVTAAYGYAATKQEWAVALLGVLAVTLFGFLDANYLKHERRFRHLYAAVVLSDTRVPPFSLDTSLLRPRRAVTQGRCEEVRRAVSDWPPELRDWLSWSIAPVYSGLLIAGLVIVGLTAAGALAPTPPTPISPAPVSTQPALRDSQPSQSPVPMTTATPPEPNKSGSVPVPSTPGRRS